VGPGNYTSATQAMFHMEPWDYQPPHNLFIYIAAEWGIIGLLFFSMWIIWLGWKLAQADNSVLKFSLVMMVVGLIIFSSFDHFLATIQQGQLLLFTVLGLILAYPKLNSYELKKLN
jgi:O-antigen ligase